MSAHPLIQVSLRIFPEAEELVAAVFERVFNSPVSVYQNEKTGVMTASVFVDLPAARVKKECRALANLFNELANVGIACGAGRVRIRRIRREDWAESWKRHFKPLDIGGRLLVKPSWSRRRPRRGQAVVVLDPGLSFGTGQHATTAFCLHQLVALRRDGLRQSFLDIGCGSGILAIAAAQLGYAPAKAFDFDPEAVRVAKTNCSVNGVGNLIQPFRRNVLRLKPGRTRFSVVCANLTSDLLLEARGNILSRVAPGGTLVLAGILRTQFSSVRKAYEKSGLKLVAHSAEKEWKSAAFRSPA